MVCFPAQLRLPRLKDLSIQQERASSFLQASVKTRVTELFQRSVHMEKQWIKERAALTVMCLDLCALIGRSGQRSPAVTYFLCAYRVHITGA